MERRRVVITGVGAVTPIGLTAADSWQAVKDGVCGVAPITQFDSSGLKVHLAAEVKGFDPENYMGKPEAKRMGRFTQLALVSAQEAMASAGFTLDEAEADRCGVIVSSGIGGLAITEAEHDKGREKGWDRVSPFYIPMGICNMAAGQIAIHTGFRGMCSCPVTACTGGTNAVGDAFHYIRDGYADVMLCGGTESAVTPLAIGGFTSMRALSQNSDPDRASIPFDAERSGFVLGEGAAILLLEELEHARARGAEIIAEVVGYGVTCDAYHMTAPRPDGSGGAKAMAMAIADAGVKPEDVDYINAHGTSTPLNDAGETAAVKSVFGEHAYKLAMSSTKSMTGHMLGAAGAVEALFCAKALQEGYLPATIHYQVPDPACDLDVVPNQGDTTAPCCSRSGRLETMANELNSNQIAQILPHRFPFALVDRITDYEPGQWARGRKCVSTNEQFFCGHFPQEHVMPGVLILEAMAQVGAVAILSLPENRGKIALFGGVKNARFKRKVIPGDVLEMECVLTKRRGPVGIGECKATVDGELACSAELIFAISAE